jgi:hypothetical protein
VALNAFHIHAYHSGVKIEVLYFDGCPNVTPTVDRLQRILEASGVNTGIMLTRVGDNETAPAVLSARSRTDFGIMCRTYDGNGVPSEAMIQRAIGEAINTR